MGRRRAAHRPVLRLWDAAPRRRRQVGGRRRSRHQLCVCQKNSKPRRVQTPAVRVSPRTSQTEFELILGGHCACVATDPAQTWFSTQVKAADGQDTRRIRIAPLCAAAARWAGAAASFAVAAVASNYCSRCSRPCPAQATEPTRSGRLRLREFEFKLSSSRTQATEPTRSGRQQRSWGLQPYLVRRASSPPDNYCNCCRRLQSYLVAVSSCSVYRCK